jgi:hypothetical protein
MLAKTRSKLAFFCALMTMVVGVMMATPAHAESITDQWVAYADVNCAGTYYHYSFVLQRTDLGRMRTTYARAQKTSGTGSIKWYWFSAGTTGDFTNGYYGPANPSVGDTGPIAWATPWRTETAGNGFQVYAHVGDPSGYDCGEVLVYDF